MTCDTPRMIEESGFMDGLRDILSTLQQFRSPLMRLRGFLDAAAGLCERPQTRQVLSATCERIQVMLRGLSESKVDWALMLNQTGRIEGMLEGLQEGLSELEHRTAFESDLASTLASLFSVCGMDSVRRHASQQILSLAPALDYLGHFMVLLRHAYPGERAEIDAIRQITGTLREILISQKDAAPTLSYELIASYITVARSLQEKLLVVRAKL